MPKARQHIDNSWLAAEMDALSLSQAELSRLTGISTDKINKSIKNTRQIKLVEYKKIKKALESYTHLGRNFPEELPPSASHNGGVPHHGVDIREGKPMPREGDFRDDILGDLVSRVRRLEQRIEDLEGEAQERPQKGRKG